MPPLEIFGAVAALTRFANEDQVVHLANDTDGCPSGHALTFRETHARALLRSVED